MENITQSSSIPAIENELIFSVCIANGLKRDPIWDIIGQIFVSSTDTQIIISKKYEKNFKLFINIINKPYEVL